MTRDDYVSTEEWARWEADRERQATAYDHQRRLEAITIPDHVLLDFRLWELEARANQVCAELASAREHLGLVAVILGDCLGGG